MEFTALLTFALLGAMTGFLSGLLGIGGGVILVPSLYFAFKFMGFHSDLLMHLSVGTSLATMIITTMVSSFFHHKRGAVLWEISRYLIPGALIGSTFGVIVSGYIDSKILAKIFGVFSIILAIYFLLPKAPLLKERRPGPLALVLLGSIVGVLSALLGIGGGVIAVPLLLSFKLPAKKAVGTSSSLTLFTALVGSIGYLLVGLQFPKEADTIGFVYLPAFFLMGLASVLLAPIGVKLAHLLPALFLKRVFAIALAVTGLSMALH